VFEAENVATKQRVALKRIEKVSSALSREYEVLQLIQGCENVVKLEVPPPHPGLLLLPQGAEQDHPKYGLRVCGG
jgi:hypothetical protein